MNIKNLIENIVLISVIFIGLGVYTNMVLTPTLVQAIQQETTKIENNIDTRIRNKFKKIGHLSTDLPNVINPESTANTSAKCDENSICVPIEMLTRRQKRKLNIP